MTLSPKGLSILQLHMLLAFLGDGSIVHVMHDIIVCLTIAMHWESEAPGLKCTTSTCYA